MSVFSTILDLVPSSLRSRVSALLRSIGVDFNYDKAKEKVKAGLRAMKGVPAPVINILEACCLVGAYPASTSHNLTLGGTRSNRADYVLPQANLRKSGRRSNWSSLRRAQQAEID